MVEIGKLKFFNLPEKYISVYLVIISVKGVLDKVLFSARVLKDKENKTLSSVFPYNFPIGVYVLKKNKIFSF